MSGYGVLREKVRVIWVDFFHPFTWRKAFYFSLCVHACLLTPLLISGAFRRSPFEKIINLNLLPPMQVTSLGNPAAAQPKTTPQKAAADKSTLPVKEERKDDIYDVPRKKKSKNPAEDLRKRLEKKLQRVEKEMAATPNTSENLKTFSQGGVATNQYFPYNWYLRGLQTKITKAWQEPSQFARLEDRRALVSFVIARDGSVSRIELRGSSGMEQLDQSALAAVESAQPFSPLPDDYKEPFLDVTIQFELTR